MKKELYYKTEDENVILMYYLIETDENFRDGIENDNALGYGVEVEEIVNLYIQDSKLITDISTEKEIIYKLLKVISNEKVKPYVLDEIVVDWIG